MIKHKLFKYLILLAGRINQKKEFYLSIGHLKYKPKPSMIFFCLVVGGTSPGISGGKAADRSLNPMRCTTDIFRDKELTVHVNPDLVRLLIFYSSSLNTENCMAAPPNF